MLFLGMANAYIMRTNMSVAIVAMVNQSAILEDAIHADSECPADHTPSTDEVSVLQGNVLAPICLPLKV